MSPPFVLLFVSIIYMAHLLHGVHSVPSHIFEQDAVDRCGHLNLSYIKGPDGSHYCNCPAGFFLKDFVSAVFPENRTCDPCVFDPMDPNNQHFTEHENNFTQCNKSHDASYCNKFMNTERVAGSPTSNSRCQCKEGYFADGDVKNGCFKIGMCKEGYEPSEPATSTTNTKCIRCQKGYYSNISSVTELCKPFTNCQEKGLYQIRDGSSEFDVTCGNGSTLNATKPTSTTSMFFTTPNVSSTTSPTELNTKNSVGAIVAAVIAVILLFLLVFYIIFRCFRKRKTETPCPTIVKQGRRRKRETDTHVHVVEEDGHELQELTSQTAANGDASS